VDADPHLARTRLRVRQLDELKCFRRTELHDTDGSHEYVSLWRRRE
jgi:hypothetical protein